MQLEQWNSRFYQGPTLSGITEDEAAEIIRRELPEAKPAAIKTLVSHARTPHLRDQKQMYISARPGPAGNGGAGITKIRVP